MPWPRGRHGSSPSPARSAASAVRTARSCRCATARRVGTSLKRMPTPSARKAMSSSPRSAACVDAHRVLQFHVAAGRCLRMPPGCQVVAHADHRDAKADLARGCHAGCSVATRAPSPPRHGGSGASRQARGVQHPSRGLGVHVRAQVSCGAPPRGCARQRAIAAGSAAREPPRQTTFGALSIQRQYRSRAWVVKRPICMSRPL